VIKLTVLWIFLNVSKLNEQNSTYLWLTFCLLLDFYLILLLVPVLGLHSQKQKKIQENAHKLFFVKKVVFLIVPGKTKGIVRMDLETIHYRGRKTETLHSAEIESFTFHHNFHLQSLQNRLGSEHSNLSRTYFLFFGL
jgi:hypothetical protein